MQLIRFTTAMLFTAGLIGAADLAPCHAQDRFVDAPEEGGLLDTQTGLVWGFDLGETGDYLSGVGLHDNSGTAYTWLGAMNLSLPCNDDGSGFCKYWEFSDWYWPMVVGVPPEFWTGPHDDWRVPTRDELVEAAQAGIIDYIDYSPHDGFQPWGFNPWFPDDPLPTQGAWVWSSTEVKRGGGKDAYAVDLFNGNIATWGKGSAIAAIAVRGVPAPSDDGGGNDKPGNGNGNKK